MRKKLLIDTCVIIDYLRNDKSAVDYFEKLTSSLFISVITVAEIHAGIRNEKEQKLVSHFLNAFEIIPADNTIAVTSGEFCKKYRNSHGTGLADAIIAATAFHHEANLVTLNIRHFPMLKAIKPYEKK